MLDHDGLRDCLPTTSRSARSLARCFDALPNDLLERLRAADQFRDVRRPGAPRGVPLFVWLHRVLTEASDAAREHRRELAALREAIDSVARRLQEACERAERWPAKSCADALLGWCNDARKVIDSVPSFSADDNDAAARSADRQLRVACSKVHEAARLTAAMDECRAVWQHTWARANAVLCKHWEDALAAPFSRTANELDAICAWRQTQERFLRAVVGEARSFAEGAASLTDTLQASTTKAHLECARLALEHACFARVDPTRTQVIGVCCFAQ